MFMCMCFHWVSTMQLRNTGYTWAHGYMGAWALGHMLICMCFHWVSAMQLRNPGYTWAHGRMGTWAHVYVYVFSLGPSNVTEEHRVYVGTWSHGLCCTPFASQWEARAPVVAFGGCPFSWSAVISTMRCRLEAFPCLERPLPPGASAQQLSLHR
jgi:hypothetical protein